MSSPLDLTPEQQARFIAAMLDGGEAEEVFSEFLDALEPEQRKAALDRLRVDEP